jgi:hypothetical protein
VDDTNWNLIWLGLALFVIGLVVQAVIEWQRRKREGIERSQGQSVVAYLLEFITDMLKQGKYGLAISGVGLIAIVAGIGGVDILQ